MDVNTKTHAFFTPLRLAAKSRNYEMCKILLDKWADVNAKDSLGRTVF